MMNNRYVTSTLLALIVLATNLQAVPNILKRSRPSAPRTQSRTQSARKSVSSFFAPPKKQRTQQGIKLPVIGQEALPPQREGFFRRHIGAPVGAKYQQRSQAKQIKKEARTDFKAAQGPAVGAAQAIRQAQAPRSTPSRWQKLRSGATDLSQRAGKQFGRSMTAFKKRIPGTMAYRGSKENRRVQNIKGADIQQTGVRMLTPAESRTAVIRDQRADPTTTIKASDRYLNPPPKRVQMEQLPEEIVVAVPTQPQPAQAQSAQVVSSAVRMQQASYPAEQATVQVAPPANVTSALKAGLAQQRGRVRSLPPTPIAQSRALVVRPQSATAQQQSRQLTTPGQIVPAAQRRAGMQPQTQQRTVKDRLRSAVRRVGYGALGAASYVQQAPGKFKAMGTDIKRHGSFIKRTTRDEGFVAGAKEVALVPVYATAGAAIGSARAVRAAPGVPGRLVQRGRNVMQAAQRGARSAAQMAGQQMKQQATTATSTQPTGQPQLQN